MSKENTVVKKNRHILAIVIVAVLSCIIIVAATGIGITVVMANGKKLSFDVDGQPVASISVGGKEEVVIPTPAPKDGYTFGGWYFDKDTLSDPCTEETLKGKKLKNGTSVYAKWVKNDYTITYNLNGGVEVTANPSGYAVDTATIKLNNPSKIGYTFDGWYSEDTFVTKVTEIAAGSTSDKTLFAKWLKNDYSIIYKNLDGATNNALNPGGYDIDKATIALADPSRVGFTFDGWYSEDTFATKVTEIAAGSTSDKTLFAKWTAIKYGIVYDLDGGTNAISNQDTYTIDKVTALAEPTREGCIFAGWYAKADFSEPITEITKGSTGVKTLFAKWELNTYDINYALNGQVVTNPNTVVDYNIYSETMKLKDASRYGYTFGGWYDNAAFNGNVITAITKGSIGDRTLFARWTAIKYDVVYNLYGGANNGKNPSEYTIETPTITFADPTKLGYTFDGWFDAKAVANVFDKITAGSTGNKTVYAKWSITPYTITYNLNGAVDNGGNAAVYKVTDSEIMLNAPTHVDNWMAFDGWYDSLTGGKKVTKICGGATGNFALFARWSFAGTPGLSWKMSDDGNAWEVSNGSVLSDVVGIPSKHGDDGKPVSIKAGAFNSAKSIKKVVIEEGVTGIGSQAFWRCTSLDSIVIANSVTSIGDGAFEGCSALASANIPTSLTTLGAKAFYSCSALKSVVIPDGVTEISNNTFDGCKSLTSVKLSSTLISIGVEAFWNLAALKSIIIPDTVTSIGRRAFKGCISLTSVNISSHVATIVELAFENCYSLRSAYIPRSVVTMGANIFSGCTELTIYCELTQSPKNGWDATWYGNEITPSTEIKWSQFLSTEGLIYQADGNSGYTVISSVNASDKLVIPRTFNGGNVTSIAASAFQGKTGITSVDIPNTVTAIGANAFMNCKDLKSVVLAEGVKTIGANAFEGCTSLANINIPSSVTSIGGSAFKGCTSLASVTMQDGAQSGQVVIIGDSAFYGCNALASINISSSVQEIAQYAFNGCTSLTSIVIPNSVQRMGAYVFAICNNLTVYCEITSAEATRLGWDTTWNKVAAVNEETVGTVWERLVSENGWVYQSNNEGGCTVTGHSNPTGDLIIPATINNIKVTKIAASAFQGKTGITSVVIQEGVTSIESSAFEGCTSLTSVVIPESVTSIGARAFYGCNVLNSVNIPNQLKTISDNTFAVCRKLASIKIPTSVTTIGTSAFDSCSTLKSVTIPSSVTTIGNYAFSSCSALVSVTIPTSVTTIGNYAFSGCTALKSATIQKSNTSLSIGANAFWSCTSLTGIYIPMRVAEIKSKAFDACASLTIYCEILDTTIPEKWDTSVNNPWHGSVVKNTCIKWGQTLSNDGWVYQENDNNTCVVSGKLDARDDLVIQSAFNNKTVTTIDANAFRNKSGITSIVIPSSVTAIGANAFWDCKSLASLNIPESVTTIGEAAFRNCKKLTSVNIPSNVTIINGSTFEDCVKLTSMNIPSGLKTIEANAFKGCTSLKSVYIPNTVTTMKTTVFDKCTALTIYCEAPSQPSTGWDITSASEWYGSVNKDTNIKWSQILSTDGFIYQADGKGGYIVTGSLNVSGALDIPSTFNSGAVVSIAEKAFYNYDITSVVIHEGVTSIGDSAFEKCRALKSVVIPNGVTSIGANAFTDCTALASINIPSGVTNIGAAAFQRCTSLASVNMLGGVPNMTIGDRAFQGCSALVSINMPRSVTNIGAYAFEACTSLKSICIPSSVTTMGANVFNSCTALTIYCEITSVEATTRGWTATWNSGAAITVWSQILSTDGLIYQADGTNYKVTGSLNVSGDIVIPSTFNGGLVTTIADKAFYNHTGITSIVIPDGVKSIELSAFEGCTALTAVFVPKSVTTMGVNVFKACTSTLLTIYCEAPSQPSTGWDTTSASEWYGSVTENYRKWNQILSTDGLIYQADGTDGYAVTGCLNSKGDIVIPNTFKGMPVTKIAAMAFLEKNGITSVVIPSSVTTISAKAFQGCDSLASIFIPNGVTTIGNNAFAGCTILTIYCETASKPSGWDAKWYGDVVNPKTEILWGQILAANGLIYQTNGAGSYALTGCVNVSGEVVIPATFNGKAVTAIGDRAFFNQADITSVFIPDSVQSMGESVFQNCSALTSVNIPSGVTSIGFQTFFDCSALAKIIIPSGVTSIGAHAFDGCIALTSVNIPSGVMTIGANAFSDCSALTSVNIPSSVTTIDANAFNGCTSLTSIFIPSNVTSIGASAFGGCTALIISCQASTQPAGWKADWMGTVVATNILWGQTSSGAKA